MIVKPLQTALMTMLCLLSVSAYAGIFLSQGQVPVAELQGLCSGQIGVNRTTVTCRNGSFDIDGRTITADEPFELIASDDFDVDESVIGDSNHSINLTAQNGDMTIEDSEVSGNLLANNDIEIDTSEVIGNVRSRNDEIVVEDSSIEGNLFAEDGIEVESSSVAGDVTSQNETIDVEDSAIGGDLTAQDDIEVESSSIAGNVTSQNGEVDLEDATLSGSVTAQDDIDVEDSTVGGNLNSQNGEIDLDNSTVLGTCSPETPGCGEQTSPQDAVCSTAFAAPNGRNPDTLLDLSGAQFGNASWPASGVPLAGGTYRYRGQNLAGYTLNVAEDEQVVIFINGTVDFNNNSNLNAGGDPEQLIVVVNGDFRAGNNLNLNGIVYASGEIDIGNNLNFEGIQSTAGTISDSRGNTTFTERPDLAENLSIEGVCKAENEQGGLASLLVEGPSQASVCEPAPITVRALDNANNRIQDYQGSVTLITSVGRGNWSIGSGQGSLAPSPHTANDGNAIYQFAAGDNGEVVLRLANASADQLTVTVTDTAEGQSGTSGAIAFRENAFVVSVADVQGPDFVAQRDHALRLEAVRRDPMTGQCGLVTDYDGSIGLKAWLGRSVNDPGGQAPALDAGNGAVSLPNSQSASNNLTVAFAEGVANMVWQTTDVGQYTLNVRDDSSGKVVDVNGTPIPVVGSSARWTVRPDRFELSVVGNPRAADAAGPVFLAAGEVFTASVTALGAEGNPTLSYGGEADSQGAHLSHSLFAPSGGAPGSLSGNISIPGNAFVGGEAVVDDLVFSEVGIIRLRAENTSYLGASPLVSGESEDVGRFTPAFFDIDPAATIDGILEANCTAGTAFSYTGQPISWFQVPDVQIRALNRSGSLTTNYTRGGFQKLAASGISRTLPATDDAEMLSDGSALIPVSYDDNPATLSVVSPGLLRYGFSPADLVTYGADEVTGSKLGFTRLAPFIPALTLRIDAILDSDDIAGEGLPGILSPHSPFEIRYGRLEIDNVYGPENLTSNSSNTSLLMPFRVEYWNGSRFVLNFADDGCTTWDTADISNSENFHSLRAANGSFSGGEGGPLELEPNGTAGEDTITWNVPFWLWDDQDEDGTMEPPSAVATFGVYRGNDRIIYWQER